MTRTYINTASGLPIKAKHGDLLVFDATRGVWSAKTDVPSGLATYNSEISLEQWVEEPSSFTALIPNEEHKLGNKVFVKVFKELDGLIEVFTSWRVSSEGDVSVFVSKDPDNRFAGIVSICKLLIVGDNIA